MKQFISLFFLSLFICVLQAQTVPTVSPTNPTVHCGDTATITASGSTGYYLWYGDSTYTNIIGSDSTIYAGPLGYDTTVYVGAILAPETFSFTNCGVTGRTGPIQSEVNTAYSGTSLDGDVTITTQGIQEWIVPATGYYSIEVAGAKGSLANGGPGAIIKANISLTTGDTLQILVGQQGIDMGGTSYSGGGGGTFVALGESHTSATPLIIAGGGGGVNTSHTLISNSYGSTSTSGSAGQDGTLGGTNGNGGDESTGSNAPGAGGGGFYTNGGYVTGTTRDVEGGYAFQNGGNGGQGETNYSSGNPGRPDGGFGGAGGSANYPGGGGGYSGGGSTGGSGSNRASGGGGSFIVPSAINVETSDGNYNGSSTFNSVAIINTASYNSGHGYVTISLLDTAFSPLVPVQITVLPIDDPVVNSDTICKLDSATLTASGSTGYYNWYSDSLGINLVGTGSSFTTPVLNSTTTYYVEAVSDTILPQTYNFTNCGVTGQYGPTQLEVDTAYSGTSLDGDVSITTQGIQEWIVPVTTTYNIEVAGAQGGPYTTSLGHGAILEADLSLTAGDTLKILVGQHGIGGSSSYPYGFAGGGGTFVSLYNNTPLIVAGGGGCRYDSGTPIPPTLGQTTNLGATSGATIGSSGYGGNTSNNTGPGGGFYGDGSGGFGGEGFVNGGEGAYSTQHTFIEGGFGSGGVRGSTYGEGCGGGYSGGNGGTSTSSWQGGAGGGSYVLSTATNLATSNGLYENVAFFNGQSIIDLGTYNPHNGYVTISTTTPYCVSNLVAVTVIVDTIVVTTQPINSAVHSGSNTNFSVTATGSGLSYQWQESTDTGVVWTNLTNTPPYSGVTTATLSITSATITMDAYYYRCIVDGNCPPPDTSNAAILSLTDVGINDFSLNKTTVYPNPVNNILIVKIDNKTSDFVQISIYDILGKSLMEFPKENLFKGVNTFDLNVGTLAKGVYYLRVRMDEEQNVFKLIKN